jgi:hypothetical protein
LAHLIGERIDTLIVVGEAASGCVRATVVDGCSYRLNMIVIEECIYDRHEATRAMNLFDMDQKYADVVRLSDALAYIDSLGDGRSAPEESLHVHSRGQAHSHDRADDRAHDHGHSHHSHHSSDSEPVRLPSVVLRAVPEGALMREVCEHPIHGRVIEHAGDEVIDAASASMVEGFTTSEHVVVRVTPEDLQPDDDPRLAAALTMSGGGVLLIAVGYEPAAPAEPSPSPAREASPVSAPAGAACPECGNTDVDVVEVTVGDDALPRTLLLGCPDCATVWDALP